MGPQWQQVVAFLDGVMLAAMALVLAVIVLLLAVYVLAYFQHPDDLTQSWWSKLVAVWSLFLIFFAPVFVAIDFSSVHDPSCRGSTNFQDDLALFLQGSCSSPNRIILYMLIYSDLLLVYIVIPFTMRITWEVQTVPLKIRFPRALGITLFIAGCWMGAYALLWYFFGYVQLLVWPLESGTVNVSEATSLEGCTIPEQVEDIYQDAGGGEDGAHIVTCDAMQDAHMAQRIGYRISYWEYVIAMHTLVGWVVFSFLGGVGLASYPLNLVSSFLYREPQPLSKSEYIRRVQAISEKARIIRDKAFKARKDADSVSKWETWRTRNQLMREITLLEIEDKALQPLYPQGTDPEREWTLTVMKQWASLVIGIIAFILSCAWLANMVTFVILDPPLSLFINHVTALDSSSSFFRRLLIMILITTLSTHIVLCSVSGLRSVGLTFSILPVHPMILGTTMIDSMLTNCNLLLFTTPAILAFQSQALALGAAKSNTAVLYGFQFINLDIIGFITHEYVLLYIMLVCFTLTMLVGITSAMGRCIYACKVKRQEEDRKNNLARY